MATKKEESTDESEYPTARVQIVDGKLVLIDPQANAIITAISKNNCRILFDLNLDRLLYFKSRIKENNLSADDFVIVCINVNDPNGQVITDMLMPGHNWQAMRDQNQLPVARGLVERSGIEKILEVFDTMAAEKLKAAKGPTVVVVNHGVAEVYSV